MKHHRHSVDYEFVQSVRDGLVAGGVTLVSTGALMVSGPNVVRMALAFGSSVFCVTATTSYQNRRFQQQLQKTIAKQNSTLGQRHERAMSERTSINDTDDDYLLKHDPIESNPLQPPRYTQRHQPLFTDINSDIAFDIDAVTTMDFEAEATRDGVDSDIQQEPDKLLNAGPSVDPQIVIDWFEARNLSIKNTTTDDSITSQVFNRLALFLGRYYSDLKVLHQHLKRHTAAGFRFHLSLADKSQAHIQRCTHFCAQLNQVGLLSYYRYFSHEKVIQAIPQKRPDIDYFFRGQWFERYVAQIVEQCLRSKQLDYHYLSNAEFRFESGDQFELDLFFMVEGKPLWIECKATKDFNQHLKQYSEHRETLGVDKSNAFLVVLDLPAQQAEEMTDLWGITVTNQYYLIQKINALVFSTSNKTSQTGIPKSRNDQQEHQTPKITTLLRRKRIYPLSPEHRQTVIQSIMALMDSLETSWTLRQLQDCLISKLKENAHISNNRLKSTLQVLLRSYCFQGIKGEVVSNFNTPVQQLVSKDLAWLEQQCVNQYAAIALSQIPDYFETESNRQDFKTLIGSSVPDSATIHHLEARTDPKNESVA